MDLKQINILDFLGPNEPKPTSEDEPTAVRQMYQLIMTDFIDSQLEEIITPEIADELETFLTAERTPKQIEDWLRSKVPGFDQHFTQAVLDYKKQRLIQAVGDWQQLMRAEMKEKEFIQLDQIKSLMQANDWPAAIAQYQQFLSSRVF